MKRIILFLLRLLRGIASSNVEFIRITPNKNGKIFFFDKNKKKLFYIHSRGYIDSLVADQIYTNHDYKVVFRVEDLECMYRDILSAGKVPLIIDCGANIGLSTKFFAEKFPESLVVAVEPSNENYKQMVINCRDLQNVDLLNVAIGSKKGFVEIANPDADPWAYQTKRSSGIGGMEVVAINDLLSQNENCSLFLVKIDIEGFEKDLFDSNIEN